MPFSKETYRTNYRETGKIRGIKVTRKCENCGAETERYASQAVRQFCTRKCKIDSQKKRINHPCDSCGTILEIQPARLKWSQERGRGKIYCNKDCQRKGHTGEGSPNWIADRTQLSDRRHSERQSLPYIEWRKSVFERDEYTCQQCGVVGGYLHAHHIKEWEYYPELRYEISNGMTLCRRPCHKEVHDARRSNRKVSDEQVEQIKILRRHGWPLRKIGRKFGVSDSTVSVISTGKKRTKQLP